MKQCLKTIKLVVTILASAKANDCILIEYQKMSLIESITVENLDEYKGIVAELINEIGIVELINQKLGVDNREKITAGQIKDLILNGLGTVSRPL